MKSIFRIISFLIVGVMLSSIVMMGVAGTGSDRLTNRFNIVFVNDESGSMTSSDADKNRYEAINLFVGLMAQSGNRIGSVSFNEYIIDSREMKDVTGFENKEDFITHISQFAPTGNYGMTNIGLALQTAIDLLDSGKNEDLPSIIILLTDGHTEMPEGQLEASLEIKADAIEYARKAGYPIYSICLGGGEHEKELEQISNATGGEFTVVKNSADLKKAEEMFYRIIFNANEGSEVESEIGEDGSTTVSFDVFSIGVEELNVIIEGEITGCTLTDPTGKVYSGSEIDAITMKGRDYTLIKVVDPKGGTWTATAYGEEGVNITFKPLSNTLFYIDTSVNEADEYKIGDVLNFKAVICDKNGPITDVSRYAGFEGILHVTSNGEEKTYDMTAGNGGFVYDYKIENDGTYYAYMVVKSGSLETRSDEEYSFSVNNRAPVVPDFEVKGHANIWPFFGGSAVLDLNGTATDPDGDELTYTIESSAFNEEDYTLDGSTLTVDNFSIKRGSFTIKATDTRGAYCTFDAMITSTNIGLVMFLVIVIGGIIVLAALIFGAYKLSRLPFGGDVTVSIVRDGAEYDSQLMEDYSLPRGSVSIGYWNLDVSEYLPKGTKLQAGKKKDKCIYLITKKPVYSVYSGSKPSKKHKIMSDPYGTGSTFCKDKDSSSGIRIHFIHNNDKDNY